MGLLRSCSGGGSGWGGASGVWGREGEEGGEEERQKGRACGEHQLYTTMLALVLFL